MTTSKRGFRLGVYGVVLGAACLGLAAPAMAWNEPLWMRQFGTWDSEEALGVTADPTGNVYLAGTTYSEADGTIDWVWAWMVKYDSAGRVLWKREFRTEDSDAATGVATDAAGNVYLAGDTDGSLGGPNLGGFDAWVIKCDTAGHVLWKRQFGTETYEFVDAIAADAAGNVYLTGYTYGSLGGPNRGEMDAWVAKIDAAGHVLWKRQPGAAYEDVASGVATDAAGNVYITGYTAAPNSSINDKSVAWVAKYDAAGHALWKRQLASGGRNAASGVVSDAAGNVYLTWNNYGSLTEPGDGGWMAKYDAAGRALWKHKVGEGAHEHVHGVAIDAGGNVYLTGTTDRSLGGPHRGHGDAWVAKYNTAGHALWTRQIGSDDYDSPRAVATTAAGNVYIAGGTYGALAAPHRGGLDAWVAKFSTRR